MELQNTNVNTCKVFYNELFGILEKKGIAYFYGKNPPVKCSKTISYKTNNRNNINVLMGPIDEYFYFDEYGFFDGSKICFIPPPLKDLDLDWVEYQFDKLKKDIILNNKSKLYQAPIKELNLPRNDYLFFPLQWGQYEKMQFPPNDLMEWVLTQKEFKIITKPHPRHMDKIAQKFYSEAKLNKNIIISTESIHSILPYCSGVLTINSGTGFESLLYLKPVFVCASNPWKYVSFPITKRNDLDKISFVVNNFNATNLENIKRFVVYFLNNYLINIYDKESYIRRFKQVGVLT